MVILRVCLGTVQYWRISIGLVVLQLSAVFCPSVQYLSLFCEAFSWTILDSNRFPLFHSGQVFHQLVCPLTVVLPQIFFNLTTLWIPSLQQRNNSINMHYTLLIGQSAFSVSASLQMTLPLTARVSNEHCTALKMGNYSLVSPFKSNSFSETAGGGWRKKWGIELNKMGQGF